MKVVDTDSKGKIVSQTSGGAYFSFTVGEAEEALVELAKAVAYRKEGLQRRQLDSRNY